MRGIDLHIPIYHQLNRSKICEVLDLFHTFTKRKEVSANRFVYKWTCIVGLGTTWIDDCHVLHCFALNVCANQSFWVDRWFSVIGEPLDFAVFQFRRTEDLSKRQPCHVNPQVVTKIAASLFAGALLFDVMLGISMWTSVCLGHVCAWLGRYVSISKNVTMIIPIIPG